MADLETQATAVGAAEAIRQALLFIRDDSKLAHMAMVPNKDLQLFCRNAVQSISIWDIGEDLAASVYLFHQLGRFGEHHGVPVAEIVHFLKELRTVTGLRCAAAALAADEQIDARDAAETFLDVARYYVIRGYEDATR
jgi:hypothetical protein